jgi:transcriptional repressor NrdR
MNCPRCGSADRMAVKETRAAPDGQISRRRNCPVCKHNFMTVERLSETGLFVKKAGGEVVAFRRSALRSSIEKAVIRRYEEERLEQLVDDIIADVYRQADGPIPSADIGTSVLRHLREFDEASHIRFALVYTGRQDRADRRDSGWSHANHVRRWLVHEYPELQYAGTPPGLHEVVKRNGRRVKYLRNKLEKSIGHSAKGQGTRNEVQTFAAEVADDVERELWDQPFVTTGQIAAETLRRLRQRNHIAYLRYASVVKGFRAPEDYNAEAAALRHTNNAESPTVSQPLGERQDGR